MRRNTFRLALAGAGVLAAFAGAQGAGAQEPAKQPTARGTGGAAATVDALGTQAAIDTLKAGGNAVDAAVAAAGVLGVTEPFSCGIGGGGFMVIRTADGDVTTIDGREKAPRAMKPRLVLGERQAAGVRSRALQRALRRRARHAADVGAGAEEVRHDLARSRRCGRASASRPTASRSTRPSSTPSRP